MHLLVSIRYGERKLRKPTFHLRPACDAARDLREVEAFDSVLFKQGPDALRRAQAKRPRRERQNVDPAVEGAGVRRHRPANRLWGDPAARRLLADALRGKSGAGHGAALRLGRGERREHRRSDGAPEN